MVRYEMSGSQDHFSAKDVSMAFSSISMFQGTAGQEAEAGMEMSALVNYIQPARFHSFEYAESKQA